MLSIRTILKHPSRPIVGGAVLLLGMLVAAPVQAPASAAVGVPEQRNVTPAPAPVELLHNVVLDRTAAPTDDASALASIVHRKVIWLEVTAYCPCAKCCGPNAHGETASGKRVSYNDGRFLAADTDLLPFGTKLSVPGYHGGAAVEVIDRGSAIKGCKLDVFFPTHEQAMQWGRHWTAVTVVDEK